jgi:hypothetical protein
VLLQYGGGWGPTRSAERTVPAAYWNEPPRNTRLSVLILPTFADAIQAMVNGLTYFNSWARAA